jgi:acyl-CoA synthetase (AMP-forming)/AMP-acid ligase II
MGYLDEEAKTLETIDDEGFLRSGDIGKIDADGFLFITGRIKGRVNYCLFVFLKKKSKAGDRAWPN